MTREDRAREALLRDGRLEVGWDAAANDYGLYDPQDGSFVAHGFASASREDWVRVRARLLLAAIDGPVLPAGCGPLELDPYSPLSSRTWPG